MKKIKAVDPEQRDSLISAINAQGHKPDSDYDSEKRCWYVWKIEDKKDAEKTDS